MVDPVSAFLSGHVAGKLLDGIASRFKTSVIERWTRRRAEEFFSEFCERVATLADEPTSAEDLSAMLDELLEDESNSEVLFEAYRSVALSRSKRLGPRIIAIVTAELLLEETSASDIDETILQAAENLSDEDLLELAQFLRWQQERANDENVKHVKTDLNGDVLVEWHNQQFDSNWRKDSDITLSPLNLAEELGTWAARAESYGIISGQVVERQWDYRADSDRNIDEDGSVREISWVIRGRSEYFRLVELIELVDREHAGSRT